MGSQQQCGDCGRWLHNANSEGLEVERILGESARLANQYLQDLLGVNDEQVRSAEPERGMCPNPVEDALYRLFGGRESLVTESGLASDPAGCSMPSLKKVAQDAASIASRLSSEPDVTPFKAVKVNVVQREPGMDRFVRRVDDPLLNLNRIDPRWLYQDIDTFRPLLRAPSVYIPDLSMLKLLGSMVPEIRAQFITEARGARRIFGPRQHMPNLCNSSVCAAEVCDPEGCNPDVCNLGICNTIVYSPHAYQRDPSEHGRQRAASVVPPGLTGPFGSGVQQAVDVHVSSLFSGAAQGDVAHNHQPVEQIAAPLKLSPPPPPPPAPQYGQHQNHKHYVQPPPAAAAAGFRASMHLGSGGHAHPANLQLNSNVHGHHGLSADFSKLVSPVSGVYNAGVYNVNVYNSNLPQASVCKTGLSLGHPPVHPLHPPPR